MYILIEGNITYTRVTSLLLLCVFSGGPWFTCKMFFMSLHTMSRLHMTPMRNSSRPGQDRRATSCRIVKLMPRDQHLKAGSLSTRLAINNNTNIGSSFKGRSLNETLWGHRTQEPWVHSNIQAAQMSGQWT